MSWSWKLGAYIISGWKFLARGHYTVVITRVRASCGVCQ